MRTYLLLLPFLSLSAFAQIPNAGFETWTPSGAGYDDPAGWSTSNNATYPELSCAQGTLGAPQGNSFVMLTTQVGGLGVVPGTIVTGTVDNPAFPYAQRPVALTGQWQFLMQGGDVGFISVTFSKWNAGLGQQEAIGGGFVYGSGALPVWQAFNVPITYISPETPDSAVIQMTSSVSTFTDGSTLWVDALGFDLSTGVEDGHAPDELLVIQAGGELRISAHTAMLQLSVMDMSGRMVAQASGASACSVSLDPLPHGLFVARAQLADGRSVARVFASY